jgi:hypothetical protein
MTAESFSWPSRKFFCKNFSPPRTRALDLNKLACKILQAHPDLRFRPNESSNNEPEVEEIDIPTSLLKNILEAAIQVTQNQLDLTEINKNINETKKEVQQTQKEIKDSIDNFKMLTQESLNKLPKASMLTTFFSKSNPNTSYADAVSRNLQQNSIVSSQNTSSTPPAPVKTPIEMREITAKFAQIEKAERWKETPKKLTQAINAGLAKNPNKIIRTIKIDSARILPSSDIKITCPDAKTTEILRRNTSWTKLMDDELKIIPRTYGIVIHTVPKSIVQKQGKLIEIEQIAQTLKENNERLLLRTEITYIGLLGRPQTKTGCCSIVVEFEDVTVANNIICEGSLFIEGKKKTVERYERTCRIKQCYKCKKYGHIANACQKQTICGNCGNLGHQEKECKSPPKCVNCQKPHHVNSSECAERQKEMERARTARLMMEKYWKVPPQIEEISNVPGTPTADSPTLESITISMENPTRKRKKNSERSKSRGRKKILFPNLEQAPEGFNPKTMRSSYIEIRSTNNTRATTRSQRSKTTATEPQEEEDTPMEDASEEEEERRSGEVSRRIRGAMDREDSPDILSISTGEERREGRGPNEENIKQEEEEN